MSTYDPFSYGQIKLGGDAKRPVETPDDILFQDAGPGRATATKSSNSDWELLDDASASPPSARGDTLASAMEFGAEVLGETAGVQPPRPQAQPSQPSLGTAPGRPSGAASTAAAVAARNGPAPERTPNAPRPRPKPVARPQPVRPQSMPNRMLATLLPSVSIACGGSATAWLYAMEHNPIMAGIVGVTALVGAAFLRLLFRS